MAAADGRPRPTLDDDLQNLFNLSPAPHQAAVEPHETVRSPATNWRSADPFPQGLVLVFCFGLVTAPD